MDEQVIDDLYNRAVSKGYKKSKDDFIQLLRSDNEVFNDMYSYVKENGYQKTTDDFSVLVGKQPELKKKEEPILPMAPQVPSAIPGVQPFTGSPLAGTPSELPSPISDEQPETTVAPITPSYVEPTPVQPEQGPLGAFNQKVSGNDYGGQFTLEEQARAIKIKQPVVQEEPEEKVDADYFTGAFSDVLKGFDKISPIGIGDFIDDMARSVASGYRQGTAAQEADNLLLQGTKATPEQIQKFIDANKNAQLLGPSQEMVDYQKIYEEEGKGFWGVIKGLVNNPSIIPEVLTSSLVGMATNTDALKAGAAAIGTGVAYGAGTGAVAGGVGAIPGAIAGAAAAVPYAFGLASSVVEMGSTFGELLTDELKGKEMTKENVKAILENPEKLQTIRNKAIARGAIIGTVDALTGKLASGVGAKIISKSAAKSATGAVTKGAVIRSTAAGSAIEGVGGSIGEATARGAIGQEINVSDIALEGLGELPGGIRSTIQAKFAKPSYKVNGAKASAEDVDNLINTMTPDELVKTKIDIKNDYEGREFKIQDKIVTNSIKEQVREANPELNEASLDAITQLEKDLQKVEGNKTQTGKDKAAAIRAQIKDIQENQIQEEAKVATIEAEAPEITTQRADRIAELETTLAPENKTEIPVIEKTKLETELETLKTEQDAIQEQATNESVLLSEQPQVGLQEMGKGNVQPEVATTGTEEAIPAKVKEEIKPNWNYEGEGNAFGTSKRSRGQLAYIIKVLDRFGIGNSYNRAEQIGELDTESPLTYEGDKERVSAMDGNGNTIGILKLQSDGGVEHIAVAPEFSRKGVASELIKFIEQKGAKINFEKSNKISPDAAKLFNKLIKETPVVSSKTQEVAPVVEVEQYVPITEKEVRHEAFTRDNAIDYEEDSKTGDNGREYPYISSLTVELTDNDGNSIGNLIKLVDEDGNMTFEAEDVDGNKLSKDEFGFDTKGEAKKALVDKWNKIQKKEFEKEAKKKVKEAEKTAAKEAAKEAKAAEKAAAKKPKPVTAPTTQAAPQEGPTTEDIASIDAMLDLDVKDDDNMQMIFNALDNADKNISNRLRGSANDVLLAIPLSTVQIVIKAIRTLVKGGMLLRDAIKKVAANNNLSEKKVIDILDKIKTEITQSNLSEEGTGIKLTGTEQVIKGENAPTVNANEGYREDYTADEIFDETHSPNSRVVSLASNIASGEVSYTKDGEKVLFKLPYVNLTLKEKIKSLREKYKLIKGTSKESKESKEKIKKEINKVSKKILSDFTDIMSQNLLALYDSLTPEFISNSKQWYVGANRMANGIAKKYNMTIEQVSGIIAALSPQNDWFNNVSVAERTIDIMTNYGDTKITKDIIDKAIAYNSRSGEPNNFATDIADLYNQYGDVSINKLNELGVSVATQSAILRAFDQALNSPNVAMTNPTGKFIGFDKTPVRWNSEAEISKAINIFRDGNIKNVNENLGNGNKVRNFYNNIVDPNSKTPYVTADTHALSAVLNSPISANDASGFGLFNGRLEPSYALVKSAYIKAAKVAGIMPREMQSITWEAQRIGINDKSRTEEKKKEIFNYLFESRKNNKTAYERATELIARNRSANPGWGESGGVKTQIPSEELRKGAELRAKQRISSLSDLRGQTQEGMGTAGTTVGERVTGGESIDEVLDLDVKDKDNLNSVLGFLENVDKAISNRLRGSANESLLAIPLGTVQLVIKSLKVLVKGGMLLRDAIRKVATDNNLSQESIKDILNIAPIQEGFNSVMSKVDAMIERQKRRGVEEKRIISNVDTLVRNEDVYKNANDAQKKILEREARVKLGVAPRRAPSIGRVLGVLKDITNISRQEKLQVIKQIRELSRDAAKDLANEIKELANTSKITANQAANIIARFGKVNMLNEVSVSNFVDYMSKVFENAEYVNKIEQVNSKLKTAKKNIGTKIGTADGLILPLQRLFAINPTLIPQEFFDRYSELVTMFGEKQAVLSLEEKSAVTKDVESILTGLDEEQSKANELADRFNQFEGKVFDDEGRLQYADTINEMVEEKVIDEDEAEIMRKYKSDIAPQVGKTKMTDEQIAEEKKELIQALNKTQVDTNGLPTRYQRDLANRLKDLVSTKNVEELSNTDLKNLLKVLDNINNNYLPHYAQLMVEKLNSINDAETLTSAFKKAVIAPLSGLYSKIKSSVLGSKRTAVSEMVRRNPLFYIDQIFGNFKTKDIFNAVFNKVSEAEAKFKADLKRVQNILEKAEERVAKSFNLNGNDTLMSKFKMMTYMVQLEYDSNKGSKQVNPAADYLRATIKHIDEGKSQFGERDANMLQQILKKFAPNGEIDNDKLYNSFNKAEKSAIKDIRGVNESLREKAEDTAAIIRGDRINPLTNYVHLNVLHEHQPNDLTSGIAFVNDYNNSMRGSTKAKSLIERTGKVSPLNFDVFASAQRGAKFVLMDYNLTEPIRTARKTIKQTISNFEKEGRIPKEKRQIINAIDSAFEEATENVLTNTFVTNSLADDFVDYVNKQGYRAVLASTSRFVSELSSNIAFAVILDPKAFATGVENKGFIMSVDAPLVMENVNSKQTNRIFPTDTLSGKVIDTNILQQTSGIKGAKSKNPVANKTQQIWNLSGKKVANTVELTADALISTPDKLAMRPMWFGSFANEFKNIAGEKVDFNKIAANDEKYMEQHKEAIEKAKTTADEKSIMMGATDNPFMGILKGTVKPDQKFLTRAFNNFNNFMTKFMIFEYVSARTGIMAAMGNGSLTKKQGVAVLGAVTTRMVVYTLMLQMLGTGLMGLIFGDGEEPEDEKSFMQKLGQAFASAFTSIALGRDFGNATKQIINIGVERVNENYLDFLREGDYDPYKDAIQYSIVPPDKEGKQTDIKDFLLNMGGAFGPALKTADLIFRKLLEPEKKEEDAIQRREDEIKVRIPLEILGNLGFIPLYKDIRKVVLKNMYRDLENAERTAADKKKAEKEKLHGYKNKSDMELYDPELWDKVYGPNSPDYDKEQAIKEIKKAKQKLEREMKDEMYDYTPKSKSGFGSSKFGQGASKSSFGSAKFGQ